MTMLADLPSVTTCSVTGCSYNHDGCHAAAVTIGADERCATFIPLSAKGGIDTAQAHVGACQAADCRFNSALSCTASAVRIGSGDGAAGCLSYESR